MTRKFKCRICGEKVSNNLCSTKDVSICKWCAKDKIVEITGKCSICECCIFPSRCGTSRFDSEHKLCSMCCLMEVTLGMFPREARENKLTWKQYKTEVKKRWKQGEKEFVQTMIS